MTRYLQRPDSFDGLSRVTPAMMAYCKAVYCLQQEDDLATTGRLSQALGLSDASVTKMSKRLHKTNLVRHTRYHGVVLTKEGIHLASKVLRHHRDVPGGDFGL
jgi:DtxR family Mn-dependent transcriptional regulator